MKVFEQFMLLAYITCIGCFFYNVFMSTKSLHEKIINLFQYFIINSSVFVIIFGILHKMEIISEIEFMCISIIWLIFFAILS